MKPNQREQHLVEGALTSAVTRRTLVRRAAAVGAAVPAAALLGAGVATRPGAAQEALSGELTFWHGLGTEATVLNEDVLPAWQAAYPDVSVEVLQVPFDQLQNKFLTEASAGGGADVLLGASDWIGNYAESEVILALNEIAGADFAAGYNPAAIEGVTFEEQIYGVPQNINGVALFYNKTFVTTPPANTDEMLTMAAEIAEANSAAGVYGFGLISNFYSNVGYLFGFGGQIFQEDGETSALNSPEVVSFLTFLQKVKDSPGVFTQADQGAVESLFREGKLAMMFNGPWFQQAATDAIGAENVAVAVLPAIAELQNAPAKPFVGIQSFYVNSNLDDDQAALAFEFAKWMSNEGVQPFVDKAGYLPASTTATLPAENPLAPVFVEQYAAGVPLPSNPKMSAVWTPAGDMITKTLEGTLPPEQAAAEAAETIDKAGS